MAELDAPDLDVRLRTLAPDRSFIVQAPAGSGKTTLLTQRFLGLLAVVERPEQIVAITFTRKAAAEMRHRILQALSLGASAVPVGATTAVRITWELARAALEADARRGWRLLDHPSRLHISTIDGLNHWLARHLPLTARLGDGLELVDDAQPLYLEAANRFVLRLEEDSPEGRAVDRLARLLDHDPARLADLLAAMLARRELWLPRLVGVTGGPELRAAMEKVLAAVVEQGLAQVVASVPVELASELVEVLNESARLAGATSAYAGLRAHTGLPPARANCLDDWRTICEAVLTGKNEVRRRITVKEGFPPQHKALKARFQALLEQLAASEHVAAAFASVRRLPPPHYTDRQWELVAALCDALVPAAAELQAVFAERGRMDHGAVAAAARWALGSEEQPSDLGLALDYRIQHLLVDEFQDTSQSQELLLRRLVAGWEPGPGRTLFCVGDPMQSVYAFREADVTLFLAAQRSGIGPVRLEVAHLQANFRSCAAIVDWVNRTFSRLLPASDDFERGAVHYTPCVHTRPDEAGAGVQVHALIGDETDGAAALVAQLAAEAVAEADAVGLESERREVAVLVRGRAVLPAIIAALRSRGVPFRGVELEGLAERSAVRDLLALARALLHAGDRTAWLAVLRAPWCGLLLPDLEALVGADLSIPVPARLEALLAGEAGLSADGARRIARVWPVLAMAAADIGRLPLGSVVRSAWLALGGPATLEDESDLDNAETVFAAFDLLVQETGPLPAASALESALERLKASPVGSASARVQLMTIHKAKGLEFDTVIVPGLERGASKDDRRLLYWTAVATGPDAREVLLASRGESRQGAREDELEAWMRRLDRERQQLELGRLAYVAVTRAKRRLHLVGAAALRWSRDADEPALQKPRADSMLGFLWPAVAADFEHRFDGLRARGGLARAAPDARPRASDGNLQRLPADFQLEATTLDAWSARRQPRDATGPIRPEFDWAGQVAIAVGTVVHAELVERAGPGFAEAGSESLARGRSAALLAAGLPAARLPLAVARVEQALQRVAASPVARHLLDSRHAHAASELALTAILDGEPVSIQIDRTFVDADGIRWIADWKTGSHEGGDREAFLASELRRYGGQLARYAAVMRLLDGRRQRVGLYYPLLDAWVDWSPASGGEPPPD